MNKMTKLLSVFAIAGVIGAGAAALAGCNAHKHEGVKHDAVAATCTAAGNTEYYTCSGEEGKYYSDKECTKEITLEETVVAATGHMQRRHLETSATCTEDGNIEYYTCDNPCCANKYFTDNTCSTETTLAAVTIAASHSDKFEQNNNATHTVTCNNCEVAPTQEAHTDANGDSVCDDCGATFFATGKYYNLCTIVTVVEIKADGKVSVKIGDADAVEKDLTVTSTDGTLKATFTDDVKNYTLEKSNGAYTLKYKNVSGGSTKTRALTEVPATTFDFVEAVSDFKGVYEVSGVHVYYDTEDGCYYKLLSVKIAGTNVFPTYIETDKEGNVKEGAYPVTDVINAAHTDVVFSQFLIGNITITATAAEQADGEVTVNAIKVEIGGSNSEDSFVSTPVTLTRNADAEVTSPDTLMSGISEYTLYTGTNYVFKATGSGAYFLSGTQLTIVGGNETNGYLVRLLDDYFRVFNYVIKVSTDGTTLGLYQSDGTTAVDTLTKQTVSYPKLTLSTSFENPTYIDLSAADADEFNEYYKCFEIDESGWYYFMGYDGNTASANAVQLTVFPYADHTANSDNRIDTNYMLPNKGVQLTKGTVIAINSWTNASYFCAVKTAENVDSTMFDTFSGFEEKYCGSYSYAYSNDWGDSYTLTYIVSADGIKYNMADSYDPEGYGYNLTISATKDGTYVATAAGSTFVFEFGDEDDIIVAYDGMMYGATYTATKGTTGVGDEGDEEDEAQYAVVGENTVTLGALGAGEVVLNKKGEWTITFGDGVNRVFVGGSQVSSGATIEITDAEKTITVMGNGETATFTLTLTSGSGEEIEEGGESSGATLTIGSNTISDFDDTSYTATVTFTATEDGDYKFDISNVYGTSEVSTINGEALEIDAHNETATVTLNLLAGDVVTFVLEQNLSGDEIIVVVTKVETPKAVAGENTVTLDALGEGEIVLNKKGVWTITFGDGVNRVFVDGSQVSSGGTIEITDSAKPITVKGSGSTATFTLTLTSGSGEEIGGSSSDDGGETPSGNALSIGSNTISDCDIETGYSTVSFTATEAGEYTFAFDNVVEVDFGGTQLEISGSSTASTTATCSAGDVISITVCLGFNGNDVTVNITKA